MFNVHSLHVYDCVDSSIKRQNRLKVIFFFWIVVRDKVKCTIEKHKLWVLCWNHLSARYFWCLPAIEGCAADKSTRHRSWRCRARPAARTRRRRQPPPSRPTMPPHHSPPQHYHYRCRCFTLYNVILVQTYWHRVYSFEHTVFYIYQLFYTFGSLELRLFIPVHQYLFW